MFDGLHLTTNWSLRSVLGRIFVHVWLASCISVIRYYRSFCTHHVMLANSDNRTYQRQDGFVSCIQLWEVVVVQCGWSNSIPDVCFHRLCLLTSTISLQNTIMTVRRTNLITTHQHYISDCSNILQHEIVNHTIAIRYPPCGHKQIQVSANVYSL